MQDMLSGSSSSKFDKGISSPRQLYAAPGGRAPVIQQPPGIDGNQFRVAEGFRERIQSGCQRSREPVEVRGAGCNGQRSTGKYRGDVMRGVDDIDVRPGVASADTRDPELVGQRRFLVDNADGDIP